MSERISISGLSPNFPSARNFGFPSGPMAIQIVREHGPWEGPVYAYRGAEIWNDATGARWQIWIVDHPLRGLTLRHLARAIQIIDSWADEIGLPPL